MILLTEAQAADELGVSVRTFQYLRREPWFVKPVVLGPRLLRWPRAELEASVAHMPRQSENSPEPAQLVGTEKGRKKRAVDEPAFVQELKHG